MNKILIIEDDLVIANAAAKALSDSGFETIIAQDGYQGTKFVFDKNPDLIILDLTLPAGGGFSVLKNIRLSVKTKHIPIIIFTGTQDEELKKKVLSAGVQAYLEKPVELAKLIDTVRDILEKNKPAANQG